MRFKNFIAILLFSIIVGNCRNLSAILYPCLVRLLLSGAVGFAQCADIVTDCKLSSKSKDNFNFLFAMHAFNNDGDDDDVDDYFTFINCVCVTTTTGSCDLF